MPNPSEPLWINRPPAPTEFAGVRLIRVATGKSLEALITSPHMIGVNTHFANRRTIPCCGPECTLCLDAIPARWHGYLAICSRQSRVSFVLELTALAAAPVIDYDDRKGTLRGAAIIARRIGFRPNSPVRVEIAPDDVDLRTLPRDVDLARFLCTIWNVTYQPPITDPTAQPSHALFSRTVGALHLHNPNPDPNGNGKTT